MSDGMKHLRSLALVLSVSLLGGTAEARSGRPSRGELLTIDGVKVLRLGGSPRERGYAHGYLLAREIVEVFTRYHPFVARDAERYATVIRPEVRDLFSFPAEVRGEVAGMVEGVRARLGPGGTRTHLGRPLDELDLLAMQALPDWYPFACSSFVAWGGLSRGRPGPQGRRIAGRNLDFFVHPVLLENHLLIVNARSGGRGGKARRAWVSLTWPGLVGALTGMNEDGTVVFLHDANAPRAAPRKGMLPRMLAARLVLERAGADSPAADAYKLLRDVPTRWGGIVFVAGARAGEVEGAAGVLERDARGTSLLPAMSDPVAPGVPAFAATNHFRVRAARESCRRYAAMGERLAGTHEAGRGLDVEGAFDLLAEVRQTTTMQSFVADPGTREIWIKLARPGLRAPDSPRIRLEWERLVGTADERR